MTQQTLQQEDWLDEILENLQALANNVDRNHYQTPNGVNQRVEAKTAIEAEMQEREMQHQKIYEWLLGLGGDFPESQPGARYNWRSELRQRLSKDMLYRINATQKAKEV